MDKCRRSPIPYIQYCSVSDQSQAMCLGCQAITASMAPSPCQSGRALGKVTKYIYLHHHQRHRHRHRFMQKEAGIHSSVFNELPFPLQFQLQLERTTMHPYEYISASYPITNLLDENTEIRLAYTTDSNLMAPAITMQYNTPTSSAQ